jgi:hypothetical protein
MTKVSLLPLQKQPGCPILRVFCEGWDPRNKIPNIITHAGIIEKVRAFGRGALWIPPFAKNAKDGAPGPLLQRKTVGASAHRMDLLIRITTLESGTNINFVIPTGAERRGSAFYLSP